MSRVSAAGPWKSVDVAGLRLVATAAGIRPRFSPRSKTALIAGLVLLLATTVVDGLVRGSMRAMGAFLRGSVTARRAIVVAALAGAAVHQEA
jgi:hypothetical protein